MLHDTDADIDADTDARRNQTRARRINETDGHNHRGRHLSYQRSRHNTRPKTSLIKIEGVDDTPAAKYVFRTSF